MCHVETLAQTTGHLSNGAGFGPRQLTSEPRLCQGTRCLPFPKHVRLNHAPASPSGLSVLGSGRTRLAGQSSYDHQKLTEKLRSRART